MRNQINVMTSNVFFNIILQVVTIVCGLIVPRIIIEVYGSEINGLVISIGQFLGYITLLESGMGSVIKASLYKPLSKKKNEELSGILKATDLFFHKIAYIFIIYLILLSIFYNLLTDSNQEWFFIFSLVIILGISTFVQYYFGITYQILLQADQKIWITSGIQIITLILNTIFSVIFIQLGFSIHFVKLITAFVFTLRPIVFNLYVKKKYKITKDIKPDHKALSQRWAGLGHHLAYFIHTNTDVVILTLFANLTEVSVYSIYFMVVNGVKSLVNSVASAIEPYLGRLIAGGNKTKIMQSFSCYELVNYLFVSIIFTTTALLIVPFVQLYTIGVNDANYSRTVFAIVLTASEGAYSLRNPYSSIIFASGHFKQTRNGAFLEAFINIIISVLLVIPLGITGVAIGTLLSMILRTFQYIYYLSKNILNRNIIYSLSKFVIMIFSITISSFLALKIDINVINYIDWIHLAVLRFSIVVIITTFIFYIAFNKDFKFLINTIISK